MSAVTHRQRLDAAVDTFTRVGSERPATGRLIQLGRLAAFVVGGVLVVSLTDGVGSPLAVGTWWAEPIVFEKFVVWTLLWQLLGLGRGLAPFGVGALPPVAGLSYWLTPGTMRLAPWPGRVPGTAGTRRTLVDVVLYAVVLAIGAGLLGFTGAAGGVLPAAGIWALFAALAVLGLRDRTPVLAARPELFVPLLAVFLLPAGDIAVTLKLVLVSLCWLGAVLAANRHLPFAVATTIADAPWLLSRRLRHALWQRDDHDIVPGDLARGAAHALVGAAFVLPVVLLFARGGALIAIALTLALLVLVATSSTMSRRSQLESAAFVGYALAVAFGEWAPVGFDSITSPLPVAVFAIALAGSIIGAATHPQVSALLSPWRHAAGAGPVSVWLLRASAAHRFDVPVLPGDTESLHYRDLAILTLHPNGRALDGLLDRAVADGQSADDYLVRPAEFMAGAALGWSIDGGYGHDRQLLAAIQERCAFAPGELRVVTLAAHSSVRTDYRYRILDAATGLVEDGLVDIDDMIDRVPWRDPAAPAIPVDVQFSVSGATGYTAPSTFDLFGAQPVTAMATPAPRPVVSPVPRTVTERVTRTARPAPTAPPAQRQPSPMRSWTPTPMAPVAPFAPAPVVRPITVASLAVGDRAVPAPPATSSLVELAVAAAREAALAARAATPPRPAAATERIPVVVVPPAPKGRPAPVRTADARPRPA